MRDILLKFDSEEQAVTFAEENDFVSSQGKDYVYSIIGPNWINTGEKETLRGESGEEWDQPIMVSDEAWWVLFRDMADRDLSPAEDFVVWHSQMTQIVRARNEDGEFEADIPNTEEDEAWIEQPVPRPANAPNRVFC